MVKKNKGVEMVVNKSEAVRAALKTLGLDTPAAKVRDWVKKNYSVDIPQTYLSVYVSSQKKKLREAGEVPVTPKKSPKVEKTNGIIELARQSSGDIDACLSLVRQLKGLNLEETETALEQIAKTRDIVGDTKKAIDAYELLHH